MAELDLKRVQSELAAAPLVSPWPLELAIAAVSDLFRHAGMPAVSDVLWADWMKKAHKLWGEQLGMLAHFLAGSSLRGFTLLALRELKGKLPDESTQRSKVALALREFWAATEPLTAEMIRANQFRQEEFLRRWAEAWQAGIKGEKAKESKRRLENLDYRSTLKEFDQAEAARKREAEARAKALREAAERDAAARGWRE